MIKDECGRRVMRVRQGWCRRRVRQWLPRGGEVWLRLLSKDRWYHVQWLPREGYWITSAGMMGAPADVLIYQAPRFQGDAMKRRQAARPGDTILPALPSASTMLPKLPGLREFISATEYEDKTPRTPGYFTVRNRVTTYEVTVYDPDSASRLSARGPTLDHALQLVEQLLGVEEAPWEPDNYLASLQSKNGKKKRA